MAHNPREEETAITDIVEAEIVQPVPSFEEHLAQWQQTERQVEGGLWRLAGIASSVAGNFQTGAVKQFARQAGYTPGRIYQLARAYDLKASMPEIGETRAGGKLLTVTHFQLASGSEKPQNLMRRAAEEDWSSSRVGKEIRFERDALGRFKKRRPKAPRGTAGDFCETCGGHLLSLPNLPKVLKEFSLDAETLATRADVPESIIKDMLEGFAVNQSMGHAIVETVRLVKAEQRQRKERLGL